MTIPNISSAFCTTGIYPFKHSAIDIDAPIDPGSESLADKTGLAFIPFYTPNHSHKSKYVTANSTNTSSQDSNDNSIDFTEEEHARYVR